MIPAVWETLDAAQLKDVFHAIMSQILRLFAALLNFTIEERVAPIFALK